MVRGLGGQHARPRGGPRRSPPTTVGCRARRTVPVRRRRRQWLTPRDGQDRRVPSMAGRDVAWVAEAAGVEPGYVERLVDAGILGPPATDGYGPGDARRAALVRMLEIGGLPLDGIAAAVRQGTLSLAFVDL